ncbi:MAG TPA: isoprenylcysteine carboxylmethyltransferase family protein [Coriobacteriia bacterium]|nr:isoprenylcysteine carboxylmethyltransferase family protein [Coriobacteriia bacterium]
MTAQHLRGLRIPRWVAAVAWPLQLLLLYVLAPAILANLGMRYGWQGAQPGPGNAAGVLLLAPGLLGLGWVAYRHLVTSPRAAKVPPFAPDYLLTEGAYGWSRNPMYVAGITTWIGWSVYYGSPCVMAGAALATAVIAGVAVPYEERSLEARFGGAYVCYKESAPRWLKVPRRPR